MSFGKLKDLRFTNRGKTVRVTTSGFADVQAMLITLEPKLQKKALRMGTRAGAKIVLAKAKQYVPVAEDDGGTLLETMTVRTAGGKGKARLPRGTIGHMVIHSDKGDDVTHSIYQEFGTVHHDDQRYQREALYSSGTEVLAAVRAATIKGVAEIAAKERAKVRL